MARDSAGAPQADQFLDATNGIAAGKWPEDRPERRPGAMAIFIVAWLLVFAFMVWQLFCPERCTL